MPQYTNKTGVSLVEVTPTAIDFYPSGSMNSPTSSAPPEAASYDIIIPNTFTEDLISNSGIQPYINFTLVSSSAGAGPRTNPYVPWEYYIRFFTGSHFKDHDSKILYNGENDIPISGRSSSLYITSSTPKTWYRDIEYSRGSTALEIRNAIYNVITGSSQFVKGALSASKHQDATDPEYGSVAAYTCSLFYKDYKGTSKDPEIFTSSFGSSAAFVTKTKTDGSGSERLVVGGGLIPASASLQMGIDPVDELSFKMSVGTASLAHSGSQLNEKTILYVSGGVGGEGRVGFGTTDPKTKFDIKTDGFKVRSEDGIRELIFEEDGRLSAKKYSGTAASESIGGIIQLSYTPGTFDSPSIARENETIGTINWVDESLNKLSLALDTDDPDQKYHTSASVAQITSTVKFAEPEVGVIGNLELKVSPIPTGEAEYSEKSKSQLTTFMEINPLLANAPVLFPNSISSSATVYAHDLVLDYESLPTSDPSNQGQVYRNGSNQLFISAG